MHRAPGTVTFFRKTRHLFLAALLLGGMTQSRPAQAFQYVVQQGDTLASLSERLYGKIQNEGLLVAANLLDVGDSYRIVPGMLLTIPSLSHRSAKTGDSWSSLANELLGHEKRGFVLAAANGTKPWLPVGENTEVAIPYNLRIVATGRESVVGLAYKYLGDRNMAWTLTEYNLSKDGRFERGQVILIPLSHLDLTEEGKRLARSDQLMVASEAGGMSRHHTEQVRQHIPELQAHLHAGRYVETLALANRLLTGPALPNKLQGELHFILTEANVALGALNEAEIHCKKFQEVAPNARLDPVYVSPKIMDICGVDSTIEAIAPQNIPKDQPNRAP